MRQPTVLIVEDNSLNAELLRDILGCCGYRILESTTATDGLRLARECLPDLVLMDVRLPDMSGTEAVGCLRADPLLRHIPVVAVTASAMKGDIEAIMAAGFDAFEAKPFSLMPFLDKVAAILHRERS